jgi:hypothetical protein
VLVSRDNTNLESYRYSKSSDWGDTWAAISAPYPFADTIWTANTGDALLVDDAFVLMVWTERGPSYDIYMSRTDKEDFWTTPELGWSVNNPTRQLAYDGVTTNFGLNFGSPKLSIVEGHEYTAPMFVYQQAGLATDEHFVEIIHMTLPRF